MPDRPLREISRAAAIRRSPSLPGRMKVMLPWAATTRSLWVLQAKAKAESASVKMKPPWAIRWPLTICGCTSIDMTARPGPISTNCMPRPLLASSSLHIASAQARARSSGESTVLTFTSNSLSPACWLKPLECQCWGAAPEVSTRTKVLDVIVIDHDPVRARPCLAGQNEPRLQLPRLQRIIHFHLCVALDQLGAAGRTHAALAGERQVHAGAQGGVENGFTLGHRHLAALAVDDQRGDGFRRCARCHDLLGPRFATELRDKALDMDALFGDPDVTAGRLDVLAHARWTADEDMIDTRGRHQRAQQHPHLVAIEPAMQDRDVLLFARDDVE